MAYAEVPMFFENDRTEVFGIVTYPPGARTSVAIVILPGGGIPLTTNRNRLTVRLCRGLADLGHTAVRIDYHGTGESPGAVERFHLSRPLIDDVEAVASGLRGLGFERLVLIGPCFGSRVALASAARLESVEALVLIAAPLRDYRIGERLSANAAMRYGLSRYLLEAIRPRTIRGLFNPRTRRIYRQFARAKLQVLSARLAPLRRSKERPSWMQGIGQGFTQNLERLVDRGVPILFIYGTDEDFYHEFLAAREGELAALFDHAQSSIRVVEIPGRVHGFTTVAVQEAVIEQILGWAARDIQGASEPDALAEHQ